MSTTTVRRIPVGTLVVDLVDAREKIFETFPPK